MGQQFILLLFFKWNLEPETSFLILHNGFTSLAPLLGLGYTVCFGMLEYKNAGQSGNN